MDLGLNTFLMSFVCLHFQVVQHVMKYLTKRDLLSCRLVCMLWNVEAGVYIRKHEKITLFSASQKYGEQTLESYLSLGKTQVFQGSHKLPPYSHFSFQAQKPNAQFRPDSMHVFLQNYGHSIRHIEIFFPENSSLSPQNFLAFLHTGMPNLKSIHFINLPRALTQSSFRSSSIKETNKSVTQLRIDRPLELRRSWKPPFLEDLFAFLPGLTQYELWTWNACEDDPSKPYLISLSMEQRKHLKELRPGCIGENLGRSLTFLNLNLSKLFLPVLNRDMTANTLEMLLASQRSTLTELQINCSSLQDSGKLLTFPNMSMLNVLHVIIAFPCDKNNDFKVNNVPPIDYTAQFPVLRSLKIELSVYMDSEIIKYFFSGKSCQSSLTELDISFKGFRDEKFIPNVSNMFPSLTTLRLDGYGNKILHHICLCLPDLVHLEVRMIFGFNVDDQLTGISKNVCGQLRMSDELTAIALPENDIVNWEKVELSPSLCSLTSEFEYEFRINCHS